MANTRFLSPVPELKRVPPVIGLYSLSNRRLYELEDISCYGETVSIGRGELCRLRPDDDTVSEFHCMLLRLEDGSWLLEDQGSTNGTFLDGQRVERVVLTPGQYLRMGNTEFCTVGEDRKVTVHAKTLTTFFAKAKLVYGSARKAAPIIDKSPSTIERHSLRWFARKGK